MLNRSKQGMALVVVLGFLSVLLVLAVGFATVLRTNRLTTRSQLDHVRARQLLDVALVRAMDRIDTEGNNAGEMWMMPQASVYYSPGSETTALVVAGTEAASFIPAGINAAGSSGWTDIDENNNKSDVTGRYSYVVADCSGLLDVNYAGDLLRGDGSDPREVQVSGLEVRTSNKLANARQSYMRFESLPDIKAALGQPSSAGLTNFSSYSRFPDGNHANFYYLNNINGAGVFVWTNKVFIGGSAENLIANHGLIVGDGGVKNLMGGRVGQFYQIVDYVDADSIPHFHNTGPFPNCVEATPLINELVVYQQVTSNLTYVVEKGLKRYTSWYRCGYKVALELWYPFTSRDKQNYEYSLECKLNITPTVVSSNYASPIIILDQPDVPMPSAWTGGTYGDPNFIVYKTPDWIWSASNTVNPWAGAIPSNKVWVIAKLRQKGTIIPQTGDDLPYVNDDNTVDIMTNTGAGLSYPFPPGSFIQVTNDFSVDDPRMNHSLNQWRSFTFDTLGATNSGLTTNALNDGSTVMYVANHAISNVAELGMVWFFGGSPWTTYNFLGINEHPKTTSSGGWPSILDGFTVETNAVLRRGLVPLNTTNREVLAAAFVGVKAERYPGETNNVVRIVTKDEALRIADALMKVRDDVSVFSARNDNQDKIYRKEFASLGKLELFSTYFVQPDPPFDKLQLEGIFRNTINLLDVRNNLYTVIVRAQYGYKDPVTRLFNPLSEANAVAVVWRDPVPRQVGSKFINPSFIRFFKWLED